ncbi:TPA: phage tail assembly chaperone family protein, TAC, partial [Escherichia coli]|nr:phage tail assembly chaperone family protein, TAC [Escherichia coli]HEL8059231.1 phage tail assembly chaperone family protein, TAC [Escherichia coli]HEM0002548.1 phage tail assembly chaperone family protein, TAC [Escherichia coli]HEM0854196.1 phage tail assembly chaperone family protein, TAC [Escherichia coli]
AVCDENGAPVFTVADITGEADPGRGPLDAGLAMALLKAINEVWSGKPN